MAHRTPILDDGFAVVADEAEITVRQRRDIQNSIVAASTAQYKLESNARARVVDLEKLRSAEEKEFEKRLTADEKKTVEVNRMNAATMLAFRDLTENEKQDIYAHQRVKMRCYLRGWHLDKDIPVSDDDFDDLPEVLFDAIYAVCDNTIPEIPDISETPDNRADPKAGTPDSDL